MYNSSNSKRLDITKYIVDFSNEYNCEVYERIHENIKSYIMKILNKKNKDIIYQDNIEKDLLMDFLRNYLVRDVKEYSQINFADKDFNVFNIEKGKDFGYIKTYSDDYVIPKNIKILK